MERGGAEGDREESHVRRGELGRSAAYRDGGGAEEAEEGGRSVGGERGDHVDRLGDDLAVYEVLRGNKKLLGSSLREGGCRVGHGFGGVGRPPDAGEPHDGDRALRRRRVSLGVASRGPNSPPRKS